MKKRPLCFVCLFLVIIQAFLLVIKGGKELTAIPASSVFYDGECKNASVTGQVYKKSNSSEYQILYLKNNSVVYQNKIYNDSKLIIYIKSEEAFDSGTNKVTEFSSGNSGRLENSEVQIGQIISLSGKFTAFERETNPGEFDELFYYGKERIYGSVFCKRINKIRGEPDSLKEGIYRFRKKWREEITETIGGNQGGILCAMLMGDKTDVNPEIKEWYQRSGIGHLLVISGLHVSFIGMGLYVLLRKGGCSFILSGILAAIFLSAYGIFIGFSVSVLRAFIMLLMKMGADVCGRSYDMLTALSLAAAITVLRQPLCLLEGSFYLSYGAILGIALLVPTFLESPLGKYKAFSGPAASFSVELMLMPVMLFFYYEIPTYSVFLNLLVIPLMSLLLGMGFAGSVCLLAWKLPGKWILSLCRKILELFYLLGQWELKLPGARWVLGKPEIWKIIFYYMIIFIFLYLCSRKKKRHFRWLLLPLACVIFLLPGRKSMQITMLDVGQGDCMFVRSPAGTTFLIDGGSSSVKQVGKYRIEPFLKCMGVGKLDYAFVSHGDADHIGGIGEMLERQELGVRIERLVVPANYMRDEKLVALVKTAKKSGTKVLCILAGQRLREGEFSISCLQPKKEDTLSGNEGSMVLSIECGTFRMLCTGDTEGAGEKQLTERLHKNKKKYTVLKVAHHGSNHAGGEEILREIRPYLALISVGKDNSYGHPGEETLERLKNIGAEVIRTDKSGAITITINQNRISIVPYLRNNQ